MYFSQGGKIAEVRDMGDNLYIGRLASTETSYLWTGKYIGTFIYIFILHVTSLKRALHIHRK